VGSGVAATGGSPHFGAPASSEQGALGAHRGAEVVRLLLGRGPVDGR
jgi:hypothetical protein